MPINSNGSNLKTITIVGGSVMTAEEAARANYGQNQQREKREPYGVIQHPYGRTPASYDEPLDAEAPVDKEIQAAVDKDLQKRNITKPTDKE